MTPPTPPTPPPPAPSPAAEADKRASFEREALVHLDSLYRVALRLTGNPAEADDLVQETMLKAYRAWHQFERGTNAKGWLLTILRQDRKSTRLNSSHSQISYAVFCLKKKKKTKISKIA